MIGESGCENVPMKNSMEAMSSGVLLWLNGRLRLLFLFILLVGLGVFAYGGTLSSLMYSVLNREGSSHGLFVPFISGYFLWLKRERIRQLEPDFVLVPGIVMVVAGFGMLFLSRGSTEVALPALSFLVVAAGLAMAFLGNRIFKELSFPLFFLATMIPLPKPIYHQIAEWIRATSTTGSVWLMHLFHLPVYREGYIVVLPNVDLNIAMSCSGIRYLLSYFVFSVAYAFVCKKTLKARTMVVLCSFPIAVVAGVLRLSSIYLTCYYIGAFMAGHRPHVFVSWLVFLIVLAGSIAVDQGISGRQGAPAES